MEPPSDSLIILSSFINPVSIDMILEFIGLIVLLACSGLISGSEVAFFSLMPQELEGLKASENRKDKTTSLLLEKPKLLLATILIANNFINIAIIILSTALTVSLFNFGDQILLGFLFQVILVTFLILLFGEVLPKIYAVKNRVQLASFMSVPVWWLEKVSYPISILLVRATSLIDKKFKRKVDAISVDNLSHALELTTDENTGEEEKRILEGIVNFGNTDVKQIMTSRVDVFALDISEDFDSVKAQIIDAGFSRIPVYRENFDKIEGVLYVKDLLPHLKEQTSFKWQNLLRTPFFVPENKKIDDLLNEIKEKKIHLAIVVDEYGGTSGITSLEDVIEEIIGDISDEFDDDDITYSKLDDRNFIFEGKTLLKDFYRITGISGQEEELFEETKAESDSVAGFVIEIAGRIPIKNDKIEFEQYEFLIESAGQRKINTIKVTIPLIEDEKLNENNS